jgi:hypothetical protein
VQKHQTGRTYGTPFKTSNIPSAGWQPPLQLSRREPPRQLPYSDVKKYLQEISHFAAAKYTQSDTDGNADHTDLADFRRSNPGNWI